MKTYPLLACFLFLSYTPQSKGSFFIKCVHGAASFFAPTFPPTEETRECAMATLKQNPDALYTLLKETRPQEHISKARVYEMAAEQARLDENPPDAPANTVAGIVQNALKTGAADPSRPLLLNINVNDQKITRMVGFPSNEPVSLYGMILHSAQNCIEWIKNHKLRFSFYCTMGCYGGFQLYILYLINLLKRPDTWSQWKMHCSLEELYRIPQDVLAKELVNSIQSKFKIGNGHGFIEQFMKEVDNEINQLTRLNRILNMLDSTALGRFFFYNSRLLEIIPLRIQRLNFLKNTFLASKPELHDYTMLFKNN